MWCFPDDNVTFYNVFGRDKCTQCRGNSSIVALDDDGRQSHSIDCRGGRQWSEGGGSSSDNAYAYGSNVCRAAEIFCKGGYGVFCADYCHKNVWAGSNNTGVFEEILKYQADVGRESIKYVMFKTRAVEAGSSWVFVGVVKVGLELNLFYTMVKYNDKFVDPNLSGNLIVFMGYRPLEGRPWVFKIPRDKPWA